MISDQFHQVRTKRHQLWPMKRTLSGPRWYFQPPKLWKIILYLKATQSVVFCYFTPTELRQMGKLSLKRCTYFETQRMKRILAYKEWGEERSRQWKGMIKDPELGKFLGCSRSWDSVTVEGTWGTRERAEDEAGERTGTEREGLVSHREVFESCSEYSGKPLNNFKHKKNHDLY